MEVAREMAIDTPARLAILGAGPIALEAALYARYLGYSVDLFERGEVAEHVRRLGHVPMCVPFRELCSPLGLAALAAHDPDYQAPTDDALLTAEQWRQHYLVPLAATDLLSDYIYPRTAVLHVGRAGVLKDELSDDPDRGDFPFRLLLRDESGSERIVEADAVLDCTGVFGQPQWMGEAGIPALGELAAQPRVHYLVPDILGADREQFAGRATLVVGATWWAALACVHLNALAAEVPATTVFWSTRTEADDLEQTPVSIAKNGPTSRWAAVVISANVLAIRSEKVQHLSVTAVHAIRWDESSSKWHVELVGPQPTTVVVDQIVALAGYHPETQLFAALPVTLSRLTSAVPDAEARYAPTDASRWGKSARETPAPDAAVSGGDAGAGLWTGEPHFYVLGAKSCGSAGAGAFRYADGLRQIRDLFRLIGDRPTLDLYAQTPRLEQ